jgi:hypothetical protein
VGGLVTLSFKFHSLHMTLSEDERSQLTRSMEQWDYENGTSEFVRFPNGWSLGLGFVGVGLLASIFNGIWNVPISHLAILGLLSTVLLIYLKSKLSAHNSARERAEAHFIASIKNEKRDGQTQ